MAAPFGSAIHYLRLLPPLVWFIPLCALMGLSCLHQPFLGLSIFTCSILYASIYGIDTLCSVDSRLMGINGVNTPHTVRLYKLYALESTLVIPTFLTNKNQPSELNYKTKTSKTWAKD